MEIAREWSVISGGAFDVTIRPATKLWGIGKKGSYVPDRETLHQIRGLVDYRKVRLDRERRAVYLEDPGMSIDVGGIGKGFAADLLRDFLFENGVRSAMINAGGNLVAIGGKRDGTHWQAGIQNPLMERGEILGTIPLLDESLVTSGVNERFFLKDGRRFHHLLDPATLEPAENDLLSVTVTGSDSTGLDALSTAAFILGPEKGYQLVREAGCEVLFVRKDRSVFGTDKFVKQFTLKENHYAR